MKRRDFLRHTAAASAPLFLNGLPVVASPSTGDGFFDALARASQSCGRVLVIVQQNGGNDGLNTVIPLDRYAALQAARANVLVPQANILPLTGNATTGLHPALPELRELYNNGKLTIVQGVSYPNPNFSHFRATDIWFSASASNQFLDTGWLGRHLDTTYPAYPQGYPNTTAPDPLAIQIGSTLPFSLQGPAVNMGYNVADPAALLNVINATADPAPANDYGRELTFLRLMKDQSNVYKDRITAAYNAQTTQSTLYPASGNRLADQLKMVARLIGGGLQTPVYIVNHPASHDTHEAQVNADLLTGWQATNLTILSKAIGAFQDDIERMGKASKVTGMTFSEFGRRIKSNASTGTDHGTAAPVLFFGAALAGGMIGSSPVLPANATVSDQVPMQHDFRQLYATVMQDWLCLTPAESTSVLGSAFNKLALFNTVTALPPAAVMVTGQHFGGQSRLNCTVQQNDRYQYFALEFSTDGTLFSEVDRRARSGAAAQETYTFTHTVSAPKMLYRVRAGDNQGGVDYSNTVLLRPSDRQQLIRVYPNPVTDRHVHVEFLEAVRGPVDVTIYDLLGARVYYNRFATAQRRLDFRVPPAFSRETHYVLEVRYGDTQAREQIIFR